MSYNNNYNKNDNSQGSTTPWEYNQKATIFEYKFKLTSAFNEYERIYAQEKVNNNKFQRLISYMKQLYREIRPSVIKNDNINNKLKYSIDFLEFLISRDVKIKEEFFPKIIIHYNSIFEMLSYIGLTDIEIKGEHPGSAIICSDSH